MKSKSLYKLIIQAGGEIKALLWSVVDLSLALVLRLPHHHDMEHIGRPGHSPGGIVSIGQPSTPFYSDGERWRPLAFADGLYQAPHPKDLPPANINRGQIAYVSGYGLLVISDGYQWQAIRTYPLTAIVPPDPNKPTKEAINAQGQEPITC